jgi:hypothetical protein
MTTLRTEQEVKKLKKEVRKIKTGSLKCIANSLKGFAKSFSNLQKLMRKIPNESGIQKRYALHSLPVNILYTVASYFCVCGKKECYNK